MKLYYWTAVLAALGQADVGRVFFSSGKYFGEMRSALGSLDVADAVARTFYLGYLDPKAQTDFINLSLDLPSENLLLTVTGLDGVDLSTLPSLQTLSSSATLRKEVADPQGSFDALRSLAESAGARVVSLDAPVPAKPVEAYLEDEFWGALTTGVDLSRPGMLELLRELDQFYTAHSRIGDSTAMRPTLYFGNLHGLTEVESEDKDIAAKLVDTFLGKTLAALPKALVEIVAVQDSHLSSRYMRTIGNDLPPQTSARRKLQADDNSNYNANTTTIEMFAVANYQIKLWVIVVLALIAYSAFYYTAFYGDYSADQMLYTTFIVPKTGKRSAQWDERKLK